MPGTQPLPRASVQTPCLFVVYCLFGLNTYVLILFREHPNTSFIHPAHQCYLPGNHSGQCHHRCRAESSLSLLIYIYIYIYIYIIMYIGHLNPAHRLGIDLHSHVAGLSSACEPNGHADNLRSFFVVSNLNHMIK